LGVRPLNPAPLAATAPPVAPRAAELTSSSRQVALSRDLNGAARDVRGPGNALASASHQGHMTGTADHDGSARGHVPVARSFCGRRIDGLGGRPTVRKRLGQSLLRQVRYASQDVAQVREGIVSMTLAPTPR